MHGESIKVAIIGAGFAGLTSAISLARKGFKNITVFYEKNDRYAASPSAHGMSTIKGILEADAELFSLKLEGHRGFEQWLEGLEELTGISRSERVWLKGVVEKFKSKQDFKKEFGRIYRHDFIGAKNVRSTFSDPDCFASAIYPNDFWIDPDYLMKLLLTAADILGVSLRNDRVTRIIPHEKNATLFFPDESSYPADLVVISAGVGSASLLSNLDPQQKIKLMGVAGMTFEAVSNGPRRSDVKGTQSFVSSHQRAFWGSTSESSQELDDLSQYNVPSIKEAEQIGFSLLKFFQPPPSISEKVKYKWGIRVRSRNRAPIVMCIDPAANIWINSAYYKSGIILCWLLAERMTGDILKSLKPLNA